MHFVYVAVGYFFLVLAGVMVMLALWYVGVGLVPAGIAGLVAYALGFSKWWQLEGFGDN